MTGWYDGGGAAALLLVVLLALVGVAVLYRVLVRSSVGGRTRARHEVPRPRPAAEDYDEVDEGQFVHAVHEPGPR